MTRWLCSWCTGSSKFHERLRNSKDLTVRECYCASTGCCCSFTPNLVFDVRP